MLNQISLIDINEFYTKPVKKRGHYKKLPKPIEPVSPWVTMQTLYQRLANYFEQPLFSEKETTITQWDIRIWYMVYTDETFTYKEGICRGECFKVFEAELIGTENLYLEERIAIHAELLNQLEAGVTIKEAVRYVKTKFKDVW